MTATTRPVDEEVAIMEEPLLGRSHQDESKGQPSRGHCCWQALTWLPRAAWSNGAISMSISMIFFAFVWLLTKMMSHTRLPMFQAVFARSSIGIIVTVISAKAFRITPILGNAGVWRLLAMRGISGSLGMVFVYTGIYKLPMGDSKALLLLSSMFVAFFSWLLGWEKLNLLVGFGAVACSYGAMVVSHPPFLFGGHQEWNGNRLEGIAVSLVGAVLASFAYLAMGKIGKSTSTTAITMWFHGCSVIISTIMLAIGYPEHPVIKMTMEEALLMVGLGFTALFAQIFLTRGYQLCNATKGAALQTSSVIYTYALGFLVLGEHITKFAILGTVLLGLGIVLVAEGKRRVKLQESLINQESEAGSNR